MKSDSRSNDGQLVYLDTFLIDRLKMNAGLSRKQLASDAGVAFNTVRELYKGGGLQPHTARVIATKLGCQVTDLLSPRDPRYVAPALPAGPWCGAPEWETEGYLDQSRLASNGLYYIVCRMRHRHTANRHGRGKFYHLSWLPQAARDDMRDKLSRQADVCARVGAHPNIAINLSSSPVVNDEGWWVIDDWVGEKTLADCLKTGAWPAAKLPRLLLEVAKGLQALHEAEVVFRELAPARVLIGDQDGRAVLTDFELAKLLDGSPSVSSEWPEDPFRAPEIDGGTVSIQADFYSLGKLAVVAAGGALAGEEQIPVVFGKAGMPKRLARYMMDCLEPVPAKRPPELGPVLKELARWSEK